MKTLALHFQLFKCKTKERQLDHTRVYPSLSFCWLPIDPVKPVKQVSVERVFSGGWLIRRKILTNSVFNLKNKQANANRVSTSPFVADPLFFEATSSKKSTIHVPSCIAPGPAGTQDLSHHHWCAPGPATQPGNK